MTAQAQETRRLTHVTHPLVQHKLTLMRERARSIKGFRELSNEIGMLLCYEVTRDLPLAPVDIETPLTPMKAPKIAGKKLTFAPILRAGAGLLDGMLALGTVSQTVEVAGSAVPAINLTDAQISNVVDQRRIESLPLITRDPYQLVLLSPGVQQSPSALGGFLSTGSGSGATTFFWTGWITMMPRFRAYRAGSAR